MIEANAEGEIESVSDTSTVVSNTYVFKKAEYTTWFNLADDARTWLATSTTEVEAVQNTSEADPFFNYFYCGGSRDFTYTCYKYMPAVGVDGNARFDPEATGVKALRYIAKGSGFGALTESSTLTLVGALSGTQASLAIVSAILALSF